MYSFMSLIFLAGHPPGGEVPGLGWVLPNPTAVLHKRVSTHLAQGWHKGVIATQYVK